MKTVNVTIERIVRQHRTITVCAPERTTDADLIKSAWDYVYDIPGEEHARWILDEDSSQPGPGAVIEVVRKEPD